MNSPFYQIKIRETGKDITDLCQGITYEDCIEEDDLVKLSLTLPTPETLDDESFEEGKELLFVYGYIGGKKSGQKIAKISNIDPSFGASISCTLCGIDEGQSMKKNRSQKIWKNKTASQIALDIASKYSLNGMVDITTHVYVSYPQAGKTDFELLHELSKLQSNGSYIFYIKGGHLHFVKRKLDTASKKTFTWNDGNGTVISFKPSVKKTNRDGSESETKSIALDPLTKEVTSVTANASSVKDDTSLGHFTFDSLANKVNGINNAEETGKLIPSINPDAQEMKNTTAGIKKKSALSNLTASLVIEGDPDIDAGDIITMVGVGKKFSGNWYIKKAVHDVKTGYLTSCELVKNATEKPVSQAHVETREKNLTIGPQTTESKAEIKRNANATIVG